MSKKERVIELLNKAIAMEMTGTNQYMYFHFRCDDYGYETLAKLFKHTAITEMMHIETLAERVFFLGGDVKMVMADKVEQIADVGEMLAKAAKLETDTVTVYNAFAKECDACDDVSTKKIFEDLILREEEHGDNFKTEGVNLSKFGKEYLALQAAEHSRKIAKGK